MGGLLSSEVTYKYCFSNNIKIYRFNLNNEGRIKLLGFINDLQNLSITSNEFNESRIQVYIPSTPTVIKLPKNFILNVGGLDLKNKSILSLFDDYDIILIDELTKTTLTDTTEKKNQFETDLSNLGVLINSEDFNRFDEINEIHDVEVDIYREEIKYNTYELDGSYLNKNDHVICANSELQLWLVNGNFGKLNLFGITNSDNLTIISNIFKNQKISIVAPIKTEGKTRIPPNWSITYNNINPTGTYIKDILRTYDIIILDESFVQKCLSDIQNIDIANEYKQFMNENSLYKKLMKKAPVDMFDTILNSPNIISMYSAPPPLKPVAPPSPTQYKAPPKRLSPPIQVSQSAERKLSSSLSHLEDVKYLPVSYTQFTNDILPKFIDTFVTNIDQVKFNNRNVIIFGEQHDGSLEDTLYSNIIISLNKYYRDKHNIFIEKKLSYDNETFLVSYGSNHYNEVGGKTYTMQTIADVYGSNIEVPDYNIRGNVIMFNYTRNVRNKYFNTNELASFISYNNNTINTICGFMLDTGVYTETNIKDIFTSIEANNSAIKNIDLYINDCQTIRDRVKFIKTSKLAAFINKIESTYNKKLSSIAENINKINGTKTQSGLDPILHYSGYLDNFSVQYGAILLDIAFVVNILYYTTQPDPSDIIIICGFKHRNEIIEYLSLKDENNSAAKKYAAINPIQTYQNILKLFLQSGNENCELSGCAQGVMGGNNENNSDFLIKLIIAFIIIVIILSIYIISKYKCKSNINISLSDIDLYFSKLDVKNYID